jgi:hypothetical protein
LYHWWRSYMGWSTQSSHQHYVGLPRISKPADKVQSDAGVGGGVALSSMVRIAWTLFLQRRKVAGDWQKGEQRLSLNHTLRPKIRKEVASAGEKNPELKKEALVRTSRWKFCLWSEHRQDEMARGHDTRHQTISFLFFDYRTL